MSPVIHASLPDTGWRKIDALITAWTPDGAYIRRVGNIVHFAMRCAPVSGAQQRILVIPEGFKLSGIPDYIGGMSGTVQRDGSVAGAWYIERPDTLRAASTSALINHRIGGTWTTQDPWPTVLPGTAA